MNNIYLVLILAIASFVVIKKLRDKNKALTGLLEQWQEYSNTNPKAMKYGNSELEKDIAKGMEKLGLDVK